MTTTPEELDRYWYKVLPQHNSIPDLGKLSDLAQYMIDHGDADQIPYMLEKPWKFSIEWAACQEENA